MCSWLTFQMLQQKEYQLNQEYIKLLAAEAPRDRLMTQSELCHHSCVQSFISFFFPPGFGKDFWSLSLDLKLLRLF